MSCTLDLISIDYDFSTDNISFCCKQHKKQWDIFNAGFWALSDQTFNYKYGLDKQLMKEHIDKTMTKLKTYANMPINRAFISTRIW